MTDLSIHASDTITSVPSAVPTVTTDHLSGTEVVRLGRIRLGIVRLGMVHLGMVHLAENVGTPKLDQLPRKECQALDWISKQWKRRILTPGHPPTLCFLTCSYIN